MKCRLENKEGTKFTEWWVNLRVSGYAYTSHPEIQHKVFNPLAAWGAGLLAWLCTLTVVDKCTECEPGRRKGKKKHLSSLPSFSQPCCAILWKVNSISEHGFFWSTECKALLWNAFAPSGFRFLVYRCEQRWGRGVLGALQFAPKGAGWRQMEEAAPHIRSSGIKHELRGRPVIWPGAAPPALHSEPPESVPATANSSQWVLRISEGCKRDLHTSQPLSADSGITQQAAAIIFIADATSYQNNLVLISPYNSKQWFGWIIVTKYHSRLCCFLGILLIILHLK